MERPTATCRVIFNKLEKLCIYVEKKNQLDVTVCFIALMIRPSSGALDFMYAIAAYGVQCLAAGCRGSGAGQQGSRAAGCASRKREHPSSWTHSLELLMMGIEVPETC